MFGFFKKTHPQSDQVNMKENSNYSEQQKTKHQKSKSDVIKYFYRGVGYSPKELEALNQFLDGIVLNGYKFFHSCFGNMIMVQEVMGWQQPLALPINYDRHKQQMSVDKEYVDISYDCAMTYNVVQPLIEQFNKEMRGEKAMKALNVSLGSDKKLLLIKKLIQSHLDFYDCNNDCAYRVGDITEAEWKAYTRALEDCRGIIYFAFNKKQWGEEDEKLNTDEVSK